MRRIPIALAALFLIFLTSNADAAARRRAIRPPSNPDALVSHDPSTIPGWLQVHGVPLSTPEYFSTGRSELEPLRGMIGDAQVVGLGDGTHGTHEFFTVKLRIIDFLVREMGFDVVSLEAPIPQFFELNEYVLGGNANPRAVLDQVANDPTLRYLFWNNEEILALVEWMRAYNAQRGERPPVQILGTDNFGQVFAYQKVLAYLRTVDPALAATAEGEYACIGTSAFIQCLEPATRVRDAMLAARDRLIAASSRSAFDVALYNSTVPIGWAEQGVGFRDQFMAESVTRLRDTFSTTGLVIYWAHNGHMSRNQMDLSVTRTAGQDLAARYGDDYFAIGTMTGGGSFQAWSTIRGQIVRQVATFNPLGPNSHESYLRQRGTLPFILPLRGELPQWLKAERELNTAGTQVAGASSEILPESFDAIVYIDHTTPLHVFEP